MTMTSLVDVSESDDIVAGSDWANDKAVEKRMTRQELIKKVQCREYKLVSVELLPVIANWTDYESSAE